MRFVVDVNSGAVVQQIDYDEYGNIILDSNPDFQPFAYAGGLYDHQTGLVRFGVRDYDAIIGRWICKDPIDFIGGDGNLYVYVQNDPVNWIDPWGLVKLKAGTSDKDVKSTIKDKYDVFDKAFKDNGKPEPTITSTTGDTHKKGSKHYEGEACDIRANDITDEEEKKIAKDIEKALGSDYDVVPEFFPDTPSKDHIHVEYDPKKK